ncbi:MAG TPA: sulfotransferase, partial [Rubrobacter sp.]|nr:sulfotransferase [Rubrobacter sp.]
MYPDFIGIGAQKAGTTWLSHNLQHHPQIWMPPLKEIHYFDERLDEPANLVPRLSRRLSGGRGVDRRWRRQVKSRIGRHLKQFSKKRFLWDVRYYFGAPGDDWYASLFEPGKGRVVGEITPAYSMLEPATVAHVHEVVPQAKIVFMMRNPIERAWSQIAMRFNKAGERDIASVKDKRLQRNFEREGSRSRTNYLRTLETWGSFYPEEQIFVGFLEDVHFFPEALLSRAYEFLGVDSSFKPPGVEQRVHSRSTGQIPTRMVVYLAHTYLEQLQDLHERFGGYA